MRIVYIGDMNSIHMRRWAGFFAQNGNEVHVITTKPYTGAVTAGLTLHALNAPRSAIPGWRQVWVALSIPRMVWRLRRILASVAPDAVHVHYVNEAALWAVIAGAKPLILTAWGSDIVVAPEESTIRRLVVQYVLRKVDLITCDAEHMRRRIELLGAPAGRIAVFMFGTDVDRMTPARRSTDVAKRLSPDGGPVVISIRALEPVYDLPTLLRAVPLIVQSVPHAVIVIGGTGSQGEALREMAKELGVEHALRFVGSITQDDLPALLASCDVYVSTALSDGGLASSTAEAMASGLPVVITDVRDNAEWVNDSVSGMLVPPSDSDALAKAVVRLLNDDALRGRLGTTARDVIVARYNMRVEMGKMQMLYDSLSRRGALGALRADP